jgi:predicted dehydrogenase
MAEAETARPDPIDAVSIVTPNHLHHGPAKAFLARGIAVICDKPLTVSVALAKDLEAAAAGSGVPFVLTHNYTGYPMVRQAREMIASGAVGAIRIVQAEYAQDWLATDLKGNKQADWRTDPSRSGPGGALGDIGTHAFQLAEFVTGLKVEQVAADLASFVAGRAVDDNVHVLLRYSGGAKGMLWASQAAPGHANGLRLRVYGERGGLEWAQETPEDLIHSPLGEPPRRLRRAGPGLGPAAGHASRLPPGHPEGYLEGFAQIYADAAELVRAHIEKRPPNELARLAPGIADGVRGVQFVSAAVASHNVQGRWTPIAG